MAWLWRLGVRSNEQAVANARSATTLLSRRRVERDDVELYLRGRYADLPRRTAVPVRGPVGMPVGRPALDASATEAAR